MGKSKTPFSKISAYQQGVTQDLCGMKGGAAGAVVDLVAATGARRGDDHLVLQVADGGKEDEFADVHGNLVVLRFVAEGSRHAATAGWD
jgi:hypothetical protein